VAEKWIWIARWEEFQHYTPEPDRPPVWIKDHVRQIVDDRYLRLTDRQRALIRDLRDLFAMTRGRLPDDTPTIARYRHRHTRDADLKALSDAGLIEVLSRRSLDNRLEKLYSSRARPRARGEELSKESSKRGARARAGSKRTSARPEENGPPPACDECGVGGGQHAADCSHASPFEKPGLEGRS